jgi:hypothetical protein
MPLSSSLLRCLGALVVVAAAVSGRAQSPPVCDGTDPVLLAEIDEAFRTRIGYGETWDETICDQDSFSVYAEGATARWPAWRAKRQAHQEKQFFALVTPLISVVVIGSSVVIAMIMAAIMRAKRTVVADVSCPHCTLLMPIDTGAGAQQLFCPSCGQPMTITVLGAGKQARPVASMVGA